MLVPSTHTALDQFLNILFETYARHVPQVNRIRNAMVKEGIIDDYQDIQNDHIAFRSLGVPHLGLRSLEKIFLHHGYEKRDAYFFEGKKLDAFWYAPPESHYPRVFISELRVGELSSESQAIIRKYTSTITQDPVASLDLDDGLAVGQFFHTPLWEVPTSKEYDTLLAESEYAAWVIYNRYYLNHFTISIHTLPPPFNELERFNQFLQEIGVRLNDSGGLIKVSQDGLLKQSSTVAAMTIARFSDDVTKEISGSYVEFAERKRNEDGKRRDGFEAGNADKIFESTFTSQTSRKD